jgi:hypothetical protein
MANIATIKVFATKQSALGMKHPQYDAITADGVIWPKDVFTSRRLADGSITTDPTKNIAASKPAPAKAPVVSDSTSSAAKPIS